MFFIIQQNKFSNILSSLSFKRYFCFNTKKFFNYISNNSKEQYNSHSQLAFGILLCEKASKIYDTEQSKITSSIKISDKGYIYSDDEKIQNITTQPQFLQWVRNERKRLLLNKQLSKNRESSQILDKANFYIFQSYYWFLQSAKQSNPLAMYMIGSLIYDEIISIDLYKILTNENIDTMNHLTDIYKQYFLKELSDNDKIECNIEGYKWIWRAALGNINYNMNPPIIPDKDSWFYYPKEKQNGLAWYDLGVIHHNGKMSIDIKPSIELAEEFYTIAADIHNIPDAYFWLGYSNWESNWEHIPKDEILHHPAIKRMFQAAECGNHEAMFYLGISYLNKTIECPDACEKGVQWLKKSGSLGNRKAYHILGDLYTQGNTKEPYFDLDYRKAFKYYYKSVNNENTYNGSRLEESRSYCSLGVLYLYGYGTKKDETMAFKSYLKAALMDNPQACLNVADMFARGIGVRKNRRTAKIYEEHAKNLLKLNEQ